MSKCDTETNQVSQKHYLATFVQDGGDLRVTISIDILIVVPLFTIKLCTMAVNEKIMDPVNSARDEWDSAVPILEYSWKVLGQAGNLSLDVARSILASYSKLTLKEKCSGRRRQIGGYLQCPKCSSPWIAGFCQPRLLGFPRSVRNIKHLLKKENRHPGKLKSVEKIKLSSFHLRQNVLQVTCLICKYKMREFFSAPVKEKPIDNTKTDVIKRKKKVKEVNAGLHLSSLRTQSSTAKLCKSVPSSEKLLTSIQEKNISTGSSEDNLKLRNDELCDTVMKSKFRENESLCLFRTYEKTLPARVTKSTGNISLSSSSQSVAELQSKSAAGSRLSSKPGSLLSSRPKSLHPREKREKQKQLLGLKNAVLKDIDRQSNNTKSSALNDFLDSLF